LSSFQFEHGNTNMSCELDRQADTRNQVDNLNILRHTEMALTSTTKP